MLALVRWQASHRDRAGLTYRSTPVLIWLSALCVIVGAVVVYLETRPPGQGRVSASVLPIPVAAGVHSTYADCSKVNAVTYDPREPCQTFALVRGTRFASVEALYSAQLARLRETGWRPAPDKLFVDNHTGLVAAPRAASWTAPHHQACAVVLTVSSGIAAERKALFPYDPYDIPRGLYDFYRQAVAENPAPTLWVGLIPDADQIGRRVC